MDAGRSLDALIAEKVMGWERIGKGFHTKPEHRASKDFPGTILNNWDSKGEHDFLVRPGSSGSTAQGRVAFCGCDGDLEIPNYSTDIAAAWEVVLKFDNFDLQKAIHLGPSKIKCQLSDWKNDRSGGAIAETAPHAICLAALKAVEKLTDLSVTSSQIETTRIKDP